MQYNDGMELFMQNYIETRRTVIARDFPHLNDRQMQAVLATEGPLLILAGAGSGKTTVLINRVANLLKYGRASDSDELPPDANEEKLAVMRAYLAGDDGKRSEAESYAALDPVEPWRVIAITFTNKAADELRERLSRKLGPAAEGVWARTFHSACVRILRRDADKLGYPKSFTIYDEQDRLAIMRRTVKELNLDEKTYPAKWALSVLDRARNDMLSPDDFAVRAEKSIDYRMKDVSELYRVYAAKLFDAGAMDFDDLLYNAVRLLRDHEDVRGYYQRLFRYVLIDEYQDTNNLQYLMATLLAGGRKNICVVGDDDQSIYAFRGATIENILSFEDQYKNARVIRLEQNYRSTGHILDAANGVIANNVTRKGKKLWTDQGAGDRITLHIAKNEDDEAQYIVRQVLQAVQQGDNLRDHAVLYRVNAQSRALEQAFLRNGIRPRIIKGNPFFERAEIKDLMAYFFVLLNPSDDLRLQRIVNVPPRGIGEKTMDTAAAIAAKNGVPLFTVLGRAQMFPELARVAEKLESFTDMMDGLMKTAESAGLEELYDELLDKTGYARMLEQKHTDEDLNRLENVRELKSFIATHAVNTGDDTLAGFLDEVSLYTDLQSMVADENTVTLMTVHSAKGLEFPTVFIAGMEEGLFPGLQAIGEASQMEEERRLAYVAITRAKKKLYITCARQRMVFGQTASHRVSRFVDEIPPEHVDRPYMDLKPNFFDSAEEKPRTPWPPKEKAIVPPAKKEVRTDFAVGDRVRHSAFKEGRIAKMTQMGGDFLVEIEFEGAGLKRLMLKAASRYMEKIE
jgi:DNA helicase-2/ATP-dependent DNA helicase PcrA